MGKIILFIVIFLIAIGNAILFIFRLLLIACIISATILYTVVKILQKKLAGYVRYYYKGAQVLREKLKKMARRKKIVYKKTSLVWLIKVKYFLIGSLFSLVFIFIPALLVIIVQNLPNPNELSEHTLPQTTKIYDRHHILLYEIYATQNRTLVPFSDIPLYLKEATIAIEDKNFYSNPGFDVAAIIRAAVSNFSGHQLQGGSTITQQLIKSSLLTSEKSITRKVEEIILAFWAEKLYTKNQILHMYFNQVPYGGTAWGVEAAAEVYFNKPVKELDLAQCAFLAGLPRAPTIYSPYGTTPTLWKNRQKDVLRRMHDLGFITKDEKEEAESEDLSFHNPQIPIHAPHFSMYIKDLLAKKYGIPTVEKGGLEVITSLDLKLQDAAQHIVTDEVNKDEYLHLTNGAAVITNPANGDILAMVGGKDFNDPNGGNVNLTISYRQPGSSIKVVTYSAALAHGFTAASILDDSPITFASNGSPPYSPINYDQKWHGKVPLRIAFANSFNIPAVKVLNTIGIPTFIDQARKMGITSLQDSSQYGLSITLGGAEVTMLDMATAYGTLANQGDEVDLNPVLKITDYTGRVLEEKKDFPQKNVMDHGIAFIISNILADNNARVWEFGSNSPLTIPGHTVSVKTGTSDNKRDNWTDGYTKEYVVSVWVGNNDNSPMSETLASGITGAAPIWHDIMSMLLTGKSDQPVVPPINVVEKPCFGKTEYFIAGTENTTSCANSYPFTPTPSPQQTASTNTSHKQVILVRRRRHTE